MSDQDKEIRQVYRDLLKTEIRHSDLQRQKKEFIRNHFYEKPAFFFRPAVFYPALSFCLIFFVLMISKPQPVSVPTHEELKGPMVMHEMVRIPEPITYEGLPGIQGTSPVAVKRLVSKVGPTMIYQMNGSEAPILVVWVFSG